MTLIADRTCLDKNPRRKRQEFTDVEQYPLAPTLTRNRCGNQPLDFIAINRGSYLVNLTLCYSSMFSSQGQVSSKITTDLVEVEKSTMRALWCMTRQLV